jgi:hypothetical protein
VAYFKVLPQYSPWTGIPQKDPTVVGVTACNRTGHLMNVSQKRLNLSQLSWSLDLFVSFIFLRRFYKRVLYFSLFFLFVGCGEEASAELRSVPTPFPLHRMIDK